MGMRLLFPNSASQYLPFISNDDLLRHVKKVLDKAEVAEKKNNLYSNAIDPFSAIFDIVRKDLHPKLWLELENARQVQKTVQNAIGDMHQGILGSMPDWQDMGTGYVFDLKNDRARIIAEIKNKWNTTKGNHKINIYDDLQSQLRKEFKGYTGYLVEIIPHNRARYNKPFQPSNNRIHKRKPKNQSIRVIDGSSFYDLASGQQGALEQLFMMLPKVIAEILEKKNPLGDFKKQLLDLLKKTY